ncbi:MAG: OmpA family protein [Desulfatibacillaceae bacterium]
MTKSIKALLIFTLAAFALGGCATIKPDPTFSAKSVADKVAAGELSRKVDQFVVLFDASQSMNDRPDKTTKLNLAWNTAYKMAKTLPESMAAQSGLRVFGGEKKPFKKRNELIYGMSSYNTNEFLSALETIQWSAGETPMARAVESAGLDLAGSAMGDLAVILISDGEETTRHSVERAQELADKFGDRICFYTIQVGTATTMGKSMMEDIANATRCGFTTSAAELASAEAMADFVEKVFYTSNKDADGDGVWDSVDRCPNTKAGVEVDEYGCPVDADRDGVPDKQDKCPRTPTGVRVDENGCPVDTDGDGVADYLDKCPGTSPNVAVDARGCELKTETDSDNDGVVDTADMCPDTPANAPVDTMGCFKMTVAYFDTDKHNIKPRYRPWLDDAVAFLKANPDFKVEIRGHTDNVFTLEYNKVLSKKRANVVYNYLVNNGVPRTQLVANGYWYSMPVATNETVEGRALNRRTELAPLK